MLTTRLILAAVLAGWAQVAPVTAAEPDLGAQAAYNLPAPVDVAAEVTALRAAMVRDVPGRVARSPARDAQWVALARAEMSAGGMVVDHPQLVVVVDRSPQVQQEAVIAAVPHGEWLVVGVARVSTGSTGRFDHYITPTGVFHVTDGILGFRAEGTLNENGIRGLGAKGMRVWDFGWQVAHKGWDAGVGKPDRTPIRLMMHATDPDRLEQRLGQRASQGCVRIPSAMNRFLDMHGVLDRDYEWAAGTELRFRALLPPGRTPSVLAGNTMVVVDSSAGAGEEKGLPKPMASAGQKPVASAAQKPVASIGQKPAASAAGKPSAPVGVVRAHATNPAELPAKAGEGGARRQEAAMRPTAG